MEGGPRKRFGRWVVAPSDVRCPRDNGRTIVFQHVSNWLSESLIFSACRTFSAGGGSSADRGAPGL